MLNFYESLKDSGNYRQFQLDDATCVEFICPTENEQDGIWSQQNYLFYVLSGKKRWSNFSTEWFASPGEALFVKKGAKCAYNYFDEEFCSLVFFIPDRLIQSIVNENIADLKHTDSENTGNAIMKVNVDTHLKTFFDSVMNFFNQRKNPDKNLLNLKFKELMYHILTGDSNIELANYFYSIQTGKSELESIMNENYCFNLSLADFAKLTNRSLSTFKRDFEKTFSKSPGQWLIEKRLSHSKLLLNNTKKDINEVSFQSGFETPSHFIRTFRNHFGLTPKQFRKNQFVLNQ